MYTYEQPLTQTTNLFGLAEGDTAGLVIAHPDDEILAAAAVWTLKQQGTDVRVIVATDGTASKKGDYDYVSRGGRRYEIGQSLAQLGIEPENQEYLELQDGKLRQHSNKLELAASIGEYATNHGVSTFLTIGDVGKDHRDHRAVHGSVVDVARTRIARGDETRVWALTWTSKGTVHVPFNGGFKDELIKKHISQFGTPKQQAQLGKYGAAITGIETFREVPLKGRPALY